MKSIDEAASLLRPLDQEVFGVIRGIDELYLEGDLGEIGVATEQVGQWISVYAKRLLDNIKHNGKPKLVTRKEVEHLLQSDSSAVPGEGVPSYIPWGVGHINDVLQGVDLIVKGASGVPNVFIDYVMARLGYVGVKQNPGARFSHHYVNPYYPS